ncbi:MAG: class I SAM-dependent methyltransferase [Spirochaetes bacterium]|nr:class I SAM-dependent methyltransferase [Spirochaetota bacterium]
MHSEGFDVTMETPECILCGNTAQKFLFEKSSSPSETFRLVKCTVCGLRFISPRPTPEASKRRYQSTYFTQRTDRGYNDYFSEKTMREITRVLELNLRDLRFFEFERSIAKPRRYLDIGCAAGYSVYYMQNRGWDAWGIDIASHCISFGKEKYQLNLIEGDYLETEFDAPFDCITLWATIEHLHRPDLVLRKIHRDLSEGGLLMISTCRAGGFMHLFGNKWRYYNFPEHLYFFTYRQLVHLLEKTSFAVHAHAFYGSGIGKPKSVVRTLADKIAKSFSLGDMMIIAAKKKLLA